MRLLARVHSLVNWVIIDNCRNLVLQDAWRTLTVTECRVRGIVTVWMEACASDFESLLAGDA